MIDSLRTSPAANTPGALVSSRNGGALEGPGRRAPRRGVRSLAAGQDEAAGVARDGVAEPVRLRRGADEDEDGARVEPLGRRAAVDADVDRLQPVGAVRRHSSAFVRTVMFGRSAICWMR